MNSVIARGVALAEGGPAPGCLGGETLSLGPCLGRSFGTFPSRWPTQGQYNANMFRTKNRTEAHSILIFCVGFGVVF